MGEKVRVVGGPFDGVSHPRPATTAGRTARAELGVRKGPRQAWINAAGTVSAGPAPGRELYVLEGDAYVYAGDTHARCECGGYFRKAEGGQERQPCPACGATTARRNR